MTERPLTTRQLADRWQCSERHLRNMIERGELEAFQWGKGYRIPIESLLAFEAKGAHVRSEMVGHIYFIQCEVTRLVKIGIASNPDKRYRALQLLSPTTLILLFTVAGTITNERELHERFRDRRRHGEWFALTDADIQLIRGDGDA